jgi:hypothetical protein
MEKLYMLVKGYNKRYPKGVEPFQMVTRILEECGEVASEVNLWEDSGIKRQKHGEPRKEDLAGEIKQAIVALMQIVVYYNVENELDESINKSLAQIQDQGLLD